MNNVNTFLIDGFKWRVKSFIQTIISILPFNEHLNFFLQKNIANAFDVSNMLDEYRIQVKQIILINQREPISKKNVLEIGPGWYSISGLIFWLLESNTIYWVDTRYNFQLDLTKKYASALISISEEVSSDLGIELNVVQEKLRQVELCESDTDFFKLCNITYDAPGDACLMDIKNKSIDLMYSWGVLEHIPWSDLCKIFENSKLYFSDEGRHYHNIGMHDHFHSAGLNNGVNFLKYSKFQWKLIAGNQYAYHNRNRGIDYIRLIEKNNFKITYQWEELLDLNLIALDKLKIHSDFSTYSREELATSHLLVECVIE